MFNKNSLFQMAMALLVLVVAYAAQVQARPFMSLSDRRAVIHNHVMMSYVPGSMHARLRQSVKGALANGKKSTHSNAMRRRMGTQSAFATQAVQALGSTGRWLTNYNTVESALLFSAVLVTLSGIMFESGQFSTRGQRDSLATLVIILIFASIVYWGAVFMHEICTLWNAATKAKKSKTTPKGGNVADRKGSGTGLSAATSAQSFDKGPEGEKLQTAMNPMFTQLQGGATQPAPADDMARQSAVARLMAGSDVPDRASWELFKQAFTDLNDRMEALLQARRQTAASSTLQRNGSAFFKGRRAGTGAAAAAGAGPGAGGLRRPTRVKHQFSALRPAMPGAVSSGAESKDQV